MGELADRLQRLLNPREHASSFMEEQSAVGVEAGLEYIDRGKGEPAAVLAAVRELETERDQLDQQVEALLAAAQKTCERLREADNETNFGDDFEHEVRAAAKDLAAAADQVRKEREQ